MPMPISNSRQARSSADMGACTTRVSRSRLTSSRPPSGLCSGEPRHHRCKVLHLSGIDLKVGETVTLAQLKEMCYRLLRTEWSFWNGRPSCLGSESSFTVGDLQVVDRLTQFQVCQALAGSFFDPGNLLLQGGI